MVQLLNGKEDTPMQFKVYYSSSMGNLYCVKAANGQRLLLECGCTWAKLQKALGYKLGNIAGCLLTHEHKDHSKAVGDVIEAGIDVYSGYGTFDSLGIEPLGTRHVKVMHDRDEISIAKTFKVFPFVLKNDKGEMCHDAAEPMGFKIKDVTDGEEMLFVTDTRSIVPKFCVEYSIVAICCGFDANVLRKREAAGDINTELAKRLWNCHMEQETTKLYLRKSCCLDKCTEIFLLHMSKSNIDQERTRAEFEKLFFCKTFICNS